MVTPPEGSVEADVCVVGAGPVGLALADALGRGGLEVVVLESGSPEAPGDGPTFDDALDGVVAPGGLGPLWTTRARGVGGTSRLWNTVVEDVRTAKYLPLDPIDFEIRSDVPHTGWPIDIEALRPWLAQAVSLCGLDGRVWTAPAHGAGDTAPLHTGAYAFGARTVFTQRLPARPAAAPGVGLRPLTTVTEILTEAGGGRVTGVGWTDAGGARGTVRAATTVLAAGALENPRILLEAADADPGVPWAGAPWLGRGLMEHPIDRSLHLHSRDPRLCPRAGFFGPHRVPLGTDPLGPWRLGRLTLPAERLRADGLPNLSVRFTTQEAGAAVLEAPAARSWARRLVPSSAVRRRAGDLVRWGGRLARRVRGVEYTLHIDLEQWPDPSNRVRLADAVDATGRRRLAVDWRWTDDDERRRLRLLETVARGLESAGLGRVHRDPGVSILADAHHHAGTTRMHVDPARGVVDPTLRVHGVDGLFVCGASVFPTAGVANPTLTALALALRLADHLATRPR